MPIVKVQVLQGGHFASTITVQKLSRVTDDWEDVIVARSLTKDVESTLYSAVGGCCQRTEHDDRCAWWEYHNGNCMVLQDRSIGCNRAFWAEGKTYDLHSGRCIWKGRLHNATMEHASLEGSDNGGRRLENAGEYIVV